MNNQTEENGCKKVKLIYSFSTVEKLIMHISLFLFAMFGIIGIAIENWVIGLIYLVFVIFSIHVLLLRMFCCYCPYPFQYSTCIFFPVRMFRNIEQKKGAAPLFNRFAHLIAFGGMFLIPQYWVIKNMFFFVGLWTSGLVVVLGILIHICGRCRYFQCRFNRAAKCTSPEKTDT